jgi:hypothetical protein
MDGTGDEIVVALALPERARTVPHRRPRTVTLAPLHGPVTGYARPDSVAFNFKRLRRVLESV